MGCTCSRGVTEQGTPRVFKVINVDDNGLERNPGKIEITDSELVWYQREREPIRWPLKSLRRYGFDAELFSFESGRRCPTGPGIYAFRCRRAEALFNLLQDCIQRQRTGQEEGQQQHQQQHQQHQGQHGHPHPPQQVGAGLSRGGGGAGGVPVLDGLGGRPSSLADNATIPQTDGSPQDSPHLYINGVFGGGGGGGGGGGHEYVNTDITTARQGLVQASDIAGIVVNLPPTAANQTEEHVIQYAELDLIRPGEEGSATGSASDVGRSGGGGGGSGGSAPNGHCQAGLGGSSLANGSARQVYANVPTGDLAALGLVGPAKGGEPADPLLALTPPPVTDDPHNYANLSLSGGGTAGGGMGMGGVSGARVVRKPPEPATPKVHYTQPDLKEGGTAAPPLGGAAHCPASPTSQKSNADSPGRKTDAYARIDFDRTRALNAITADTEDEGARKTRHNSNIDDLYGPQTE